jgi:ABC-type nitrate/sulfonate/bicarbonate transport system substrate-binding protein
MEWRACERFGIVPANVKREWDENPAWVQALLMAYDQVRAIETQDMKNMHLEAMFSALAGAKR